MLRQTFGQLVDGKCPPAGLEGVPQNDETRPTEVEWTEYEISAKTTIDDLEAATDYVVTV
jgi:hypothetical protein